MGIFFKNIFDIYLVFKGRFFFFLMNQASFISVTEYSNWSPQTVLFSGNAVCSDFLSHPLTKPQCWNTVGRNLCSKQRTKQAHQSTLMSKTFFSLCQHNALPDLDFFQMIHQQLSLKSLLQNGLVPLPCPPSPKSTSLYHSFLFPSFPKAVFSTAFCFLSTLYCSHAVKTKQTFCNNSPSSDLFWVLAVRIQSKDRTPKCNTKWNSSFITALVARRKPPNLATDTASDNSWWLETLKLMSWDCKCFLVWNIILSEAGCKWCMYNMWQTYPFVQSKPQYKNHAINTARVEILLYLSSLLWIVILQGITEYHGKHLAFCRPPLHKTVETVFVF